MALFDAAELRTSGLNKEKSLRRKLRITKVTARTTAAVPVPVLAVLRLDRVATWSIEAADFACDHVHWPAC